LIRGHQIIIIIIRLARTNAHTFVHIYMYIISTQESRHYEKHLMELKKSCASRLFAFHILRIYISFNAFRLYIYDYNNTQAI